MGDKNADTQPQVSTPLSLYDDLADDFATLDNAAMLCTSREKAVREAFTERPVCMMCSRIKAPAGRSLSDTAGYCTSGCEGFYQPPLPLNLFAGEKVAIQRVVFALINAGDDIKALWEAAEAGIPPIRGNEAVYPEWQKDIRAAVEALRPMFGEEVASGIDRG